MRLLTLFKKANIKSDNLVDFEVKGIASSSKDVKEGFIFVPLKGEKFDGADFISDAIKNGAKLVIADRLMQTPVPFVKVDDARLVLARLSNLIYPSSEVKKIAVTGTNGKTSIAFFVYQLLKQCQIKVASIGTLGVYVDDVLEKGQMTTPDSVTLCKKLNELQKKEVKAVIMEASSHGLSQKRLDGFSFSCAGFTNLTRDHLDYHKSMQNYFEAKVYLFSSLLDQNGVAVLNADDDRFFDLKTVCEERNISVFSYGYNGSDLKIEKIESCEEGQKLTIKTKKGTKEIKIGVFGSFQVYNMLCAVGLVSRMGIDVDNILLKLADLKAPKGRLELISTHKGGKIFVDYAHTPDALENVLKSLRPHTRGRLSVLIGCGGNRDSGKRSIMGKIADKYADVVYITDDNPRFENPIDIQNAIKSACPKGIMVSDRREAICQAVQNLSEKDTLVVCGKGHETGQIIEGVTYPFDDTAEILRAVQINSQPLIWDRISLSEALNVEVSSASQITGISIDTRTLVPGDLFIAFKGEKQDGHQYVKTAIEKGASLCLVEHLVDGVFSNRQIEVPNTMRALEKMALYARKRSKARFIAITGSSGKTTTKEMLKACLSSKGLVSATKGNFNNEIGVPITLASIPPEAKYAVVELGMNHKGEISKLTKMVQPDVSVITMVGTAHQEFFDTPDGIALAKAEIFDGQKEGAIAILNRNTSFFEVLKKKAEEKKLKILTFGEASDADIILKETVIQNDCLVRMTYQNEDYAYRICFLGKHFAMNSLAVLGAVSALDIDMKDVLLAIEKTTPIKGRGLIKKVKLSKGGFITLIDDCYNANPSSMIASLQVLGSQKKGRRVAVLGQMMELGENAPKMHANLLSSIFENQIEKVFLIGPLMKNLSCILPSEVLGGYFETIRELTNALKMYLTEGDVVLVKGSNSVGLNKVVSELEKEI